MQQIDIEKTQTDAAILDKIAEIYKCHWREIPDRVKKDLERIEELKKEIKHKEKIYAAN